MPAGFAEQSGAGWRIAVPTTWKDQKTPAAWAVSDPQAVDDFHANVNVVTEPFTGDSYEYARANEAALRHESRATVEVVREDVVDGDPTLVIESRWSPTPPSTVAYRTMQTVLVVAGHGLRRDVLGLVERLRALPLDVRVDPALLRRRALRRQLRPRRDCGLSTRVLRYTRAREDRMALPRRGAVLFSATSGARGCSSRPSR